MNRRMAMLALAAACISFAALPGQTRAQDATKTYEMGPQGEITHFLALGYVPLAIEKFSPTKDQAALGKVLDADLLAAAGGEGKVQPVGGQKVKVAASSEVRSAVELTWRLARTALHADSRLLVADAVYGPFR